MSIDWKKIAWGGGILAVILIVALLLRFFFGGTSATVTPTPGGGSFGGQGNTTSVSPQTSQTAPPPLFVSGGAQNIPAVFKIADGPVAGAVLIQTLHPTTTIARYISASDGHVYDLPLDSPGAVPRTVSNTTIPGISRVLWSKNGTVAVAQYIDSSTTVRTLSLQFSMSSATSSASRTPTGIHFFPDNLRGIAISPDGASLAYLKASPGGGVDGFTAPISGVGEKKIFSFPLSQVALSWPSVGSFLLYTKSAAGVPGVAFSIDAKSGATERLISASGLTAGMNPAASVLVYTTDAGASVRTFVEYLRTGAVRSLSLSAITFGPLFPEKCSWSAASSAMLYCAAEQSVNTPSGFLDLWYQGRASAPDSLLSLDTSSGTTTVLAVPSSFVGAEAPDIIALGGSPDGKYLFFITKHTRTLWGVRLP